jgi:hypothetical protein
VGSAGGRVVPAAGSLHGSGRVIGRPRDERAVMVYN